MIAEKDFDYNDETELLEDLDFGGKTEEEVNQKIEFVEQNLWTKLARVGKKISFAKDIFALVNYMRDADVPWYRKTIVAAALIYFITPIDAIPDFTPFFGYLDDLEVIAALLKFLGRELIPYYDVSYRS